MRESCDDYYQYLINCHYLDEVVRKENYVQYEICPDFGTGIFRRLMLGNGLEITFNQNYRAKANVSLEDMNGSNMIEITYCTSGKGVITHYPAKQTFTFRQGDLIFYRQDLSNTGCEMVIENYSGISIVFDANTISQYLSRQRHIKASKQWDEAITSVFQGDVHFKIAASVPLQHSLQQLTALQHAADENAFRLLEWQGKIMQIIANAVEFASEPTKFNRVSLWEEDIERLYQARDRLLHHLDNPPSISELAHDCHLNTCKLKNGFKQLFQNTVYGYLREARMYKAENLLKNSRLSVGDIANAVGYSNPSQFSKAFKTQFDVSPHLYRNLFQQRLASRSNI